MSDRMTINGPVDIKDNSTERVAFDLMQKIVDAEIAYSEGKYLKPSPREYYLKLYNQCHKVVDRTSVDIDKLLNN
ncbi:hypothetical protein [Acinetobacter rudis]|uniref:Uncharacterized protein n=1 Tax=Acinetobacter rudis TaxID=632955 RepID=A0AAW8JBT7_9GAMM|nr:hypothetical protein [Acinetobacter rudis]MDQ8937048.1 hypothetical protein [Acinetobacter rudis]MDQ9019253.1 hypothetical protein [Acinetobacter rudis]